jgi:hypothetical protein
MTSKDALDVGVVGVALLQATRLDGSGLGVALLPSLS